MGHCDMTGGKRSQPLGFPCLCAELSPAPLHVPPWLLTLCSRLRCLLLLLPQMLMAGQSSTGIKAEPVELPAASRTAASTAATDLLWSMDAVAAGLDTKVPMDLVPTAATSQVMAGMDGLTWAPLPGADPFSTSSLTQAKQQALAAPQVALGSGVGYMPATSSAPLRSFSLPEPGLPSMPVPPSGPAGMQWPGAHQPPAGGSGGQQQQAAVQQRAASEGGAGSSGRVQSLRFQPAGMPCQSVTLQPAMPPPCPWSSRCVGQSVSGGCLAGCRALWVVVVLSGGAEGAVFFWW